VVIGPLSSWLGIRAPFVLLAAVAGVLTVAAALPPDVKAESEQHIGFLDTFRIAARSRLMACAVLVMSLVAVMSGLVETLVPLRLGEAGYTALAISLVLGLAGVAAAGTQLAIGRVYDRIGGLRVAAISIAAMSVVLAVLAIPQSAVAVAVIYVLGTPAISGQYAVAFPLAAAGADEVGLPHGMVLGAMNVCWGFGFFVGPAAGAAIAQASSDRLTYMLAACVTALALPLLRALALQPRECQEPA
jgi:predicted MFS family arabinose efflux permease